MCSPSSFSGLFNNMQTSLAEVQQGTPTVDSGRIPCTVARNDHIQRNLVQLFQPYDRARGQKMFQNSGKCKRKTTHGTTHSETWTHDFFCLAETNVQTVPNGEDRIGLQNSDLGRKKITFADKNGGFSELCETLFSHFPQLKGAGGFQMLRSVNKTKQLAPIPMPASGYSVKFLRTESGLNQAMAYIRPLQNDLESIAKREAEECHEVVMEK
ncbi:UNVERIFIED_CONTAM: hypothetical protein FKN15_033563 [Acipenser sinensis]